MKLTKYFYNGELCRAWLPDGTPSLLINVVVIGNDNS